MKDQPEVVYLCRGIGAECYLQPGCSYREDPVSQTDMVCYHTTHPEFAKYGACQNPNLNDPDRPSSFLFNERPEGCGPSYYWEVENDEQCGTPG